MRSTVSESTSLPIKELIQKHYIPWYCDVDTSTEWYAYASGLGSFILPLIAVIDPAAPNTYLSRTTGIQSPTDFYAKLWVPLPGDAGRPDSQRNQTTDRRREVCLPVTTVWQQAYERQYGAGGVAADGVTSLAYTSVASSTVLVTTPARCVCLTAPILLKKRL